jgi:exodeoxyribonuclease VII large subunit
LSYLEAQQQLIQAIISRPVLASPFGFIDAQTEALDQIKKRLVEILDWRLSRAEADLTNLVTSARALSPKLTLERGYALVTDGEGQILREIKEGSEFIVQLSKQEIMANAIKVRKK